jgi:hypothetical protein
MTFEEAFLKSARQYFKGIEAEELRGASGKRAKYTKKYFDAIGEENGFPSIDKKVEKDLKEKPVTKDKGKY